jgi:hypothetical protein
MSSIHNYSAQFVQDKCDLLNSFQVGEAVKIVNLRGREWTNAQGETVYFNTIQGWRIAKLQADAPAAGQTTYASSASLLATNLNEEEPDDLPFNQAKHK